MGRVLSSIVIENVVFVLLLIAAKITKQIVGTGQQISEMLSLRVFFLLFVDLLKNF